MGVIDSEHPDPGAFGEAELEILTTVAAMAGAKLELLAESRRSAQRYSDLVAAHTQLVQETDARKSLEASLSEARRLEAVGKLAGRFAHEFNNILTVILGNLDLMGQDISRDETALCLGDARASAEQGARLMRDLLAIAQRTRLEPAETNLNAIVTACCRPPIPSRQGPLTYLEPAPWTAMADRSAMQGALQRLLENARDAMVPTGTVVIKTENVVHTLATAPAPPKACHQGAMCGLTS